MTFDEDWKYAEALAKSKYFLTGDKKALLTASEIFAKILYGKELGLGRVASLRNVDFIRGNLSLRAYGMGALVKASGKYDYEVAETSDSGCKIKFYRLTDAGKREYLGESSFGPTDFARAGIRNEVYGTYPTEMYFCRALKRGAMFYCPDVFAGAASSPEEASDTSAFSEGDEITIPPPETSAVTSIPKMPKIKIGSAPATTLSEKMEVTPGSSALAPDCDLDGLLPGGSLLSRLAAMQPDEVVAPADAMEIHCHLINRFHLADDPKFAEKQAKLAWQAVGVTKGGPVARAQLTELAKIVNSKSLETISTN